MTEAITTPFGAWESPLTVEKLTSHSPVGFSQLRSCGDDLLWVESRAHEAGRRVIVRFNEDAISDVTPVGYSVLSRVHEYGGVAYCTSADTVYFVNGDDQNIYAQPIDDPSTVTQVTSTDVNERFADPVYDQVGKRLVCVRESHEVVSEPENDVVAIDLQSGHVTPLHQGHDFYAHARLTPSGNKIAFLAWDHPNMPWNGTQLYVMTLQPTVGDASIIAGGQTESVFQPEWLTDDKLVFSSDRSGFYDLYVFSSEGTYSIAADEREYGHAMWQIGSTQFAAVNDTLVLASPDQNELSLVDSFRGMSTPVESGASSYRDIVKFREGFAFCQSDVDKTNVVRIRDSFSGESRTIKDAGESPIDSEYISRPESITFPGSHGDEVQAYYYAPNNPKCTAPENERPPLLVQAHGGPTSSTSPSLNPKIQFYTSRGWAVLDVNYSGSTGFGRAYRDRLLNEWGNRDVEDLAAGVRYLISLDLVDPQRVAISGGSAGGFTVLRALTTTSVFKVGASHYGVADLRALAEDTHKFESRYIDQLVPEDELDARSPINHVNDLNCPVIFSQGLEDKIVPPDQSRVMFEALKSKGIPTALFMFEGEPHGFRQLETQITCLKGDYYFFSRVFGFTPVGIAESALADAESANMAKL
ncbi:MAG: prolyl oligopeptidase family serine peptidase [Gammaproteobacteria bacterium]|nr:prolyl oligopeptidase family serine peptidase [Gammaproteobacteria bacterium]